MSLPGGRQIVVDGKNYEWICKQDKRASRYEEDDYGDDVPVYDKVVTIRANENGKLVQHRVDRASVMPEFIACLIRTDVSQGNL